MTGPVKRFRWRPCPVTPADPHRFVEALGVDPYLIRWGSRNTPRDTSAVELPHTSERALGLVERVFVAKGLAMPVRPA